MTNFSDLSFIFRFLPLMLLAFYCTPHNYRTFTLLVGSVFFYGAGDFKFLALLLFAVIVNALLAEGCYRKEKSFLTCAILFNIALLSLFKILGAWKGSVFFPLGISFYTFKMISYQVDLYRSEEKKKPTTVQTVTYFTMFPQVVQGPIMRYSDMVACRAIRKQSLTEILEQIEEGCRYFAFGFFLKVLLADRFSMCFAEIGRIGYESISTPLSWIGTAAYSLNLYYDFWGYSLMAAGLGVMLGFPFVENFRHPYAANGVADYYRRWHMTLGSFFRDYVYIPLGGSRDGNKKTLRNLFIVWALTGFWHGANLNFFLWAFLLFLLIVSEKYLVTKFPDVMQTVVRRFHVLVLIPLTWTVFALPDRHELAAYFLRLFPLQGTPAIVNPLDYVQVLRDYGWLFVPGVVLLIPKVFTVMEKNRRHAVMTVALFALFWVSVYFVSSSAGNPFMYANF